MVIHKVSQMYIKKNPLSSSLNEKYIQFPHTITLLRKTKKKKTEKCREEEKMMWQQWGEVPPNSCKQISTMKDVFTEMQTKCRTFLTPSIRLPVCFFSFSFLHHMALPNEPCTCTSFLFCSSKKKRKTNSFLCGAANSSSTVADLERLVSAEWISVK